jgi:hypothetical protein
VVVPRPSRISSSGAVGSAGSAVKRTLVSCNSIDSSMSKPMMPMHPVAVPGAPHRPRGVSIQHHEHRPSALPAKGRTYPWSTLSRSTGSRGTECNAPTSDPALSPPLGRLLQSAGQHFEHA